MARSGEKVSPKREIVVSHCFTLAQARKSSLSETDALGWAKIPSLSENGEDSCLSVLVELVCLIFPKLWELYACVCDDWA